MPAPDITALWSRQNYEGTLGYPADPNAEITNWNLIGTIEGFFWFSTDPAEELMQIVADAGATFSAASDFTWEINGVTYTIPMVTLNEP